MASQANSINHFQTLPKNCRGRNTPKLILRGHHHHDTKTRQRYHTKKENYRSISLMNIDVKSSRKSQQTESNNILKRSYHDQVGFIPGIQGFFNILKTTNVIHHINKLRNIYTNKCKMVSQWEAAAQHREIISMLCKYLEGWDSVGAREAQEGGDMVIYVGIWLIHFVAQQKRAQYCEAIILQ